MNVSLRLRNKIMEEPCVQWFKQALERETDTDEDFCISELTVWDYIYELRLVYQDLGKPTNEKFTIDEARAWKKKAQERLGRKTLAKKVAAINHYLRLVCDYEGKQIKVRNIERKKKPTVLNYEQVMSMVKFAESEGKHTDAMMIYFGFKCGGPRKDNIHRVKLSDLGLESERKWVRFTRMKGDREHICPISNEDAKKIQYYIERHRPRPAKGHEDYLFLMPNGRKVNPNKLSYSLKRIAVKLNILEPVHPHTLRTSFIMWMKSLGKGEHQIMVYTGHKSAKTIYESYTIIEDQEKEYEWLNKPQEADKAPAPMPTPNKAPTSQPPDIDKLLELERLRNENLRLQVGMGPDLPTQPQKTAIGHTIRDTL